MNMFGRKLDANSETSVLNLKLNLTCGQAFRWRTCENFLIGVMEHRVWQLKQDNDHIYYKVIACPHWKFNQISEKLKKSSRKRKSTGNVAVNTNKCLDTKRICECSSFEEKILCDYLRLNIDLKKLYTEWKNRDEKFTHISSSTPGIRVLRQNPLETLFCFLCSVNNNITRIVSMIERMCKLYGNKLLEYKGTTFHDFPTLGMLASKDTDEDLRKLGFGYRAPFIGKCAKEVMSKGGEVWLESLRKQTYKKAFTALTDLTGVGMKVADCVCLMAMDKLEAVPLDTHVRQVALRDYNFKVKTKTLSTRSYTEMGSFFRSLWGGYAGWAQAVIFVNEIKELPQIYAINEDVVK
uniref:N-glycosylase/DNA lyase-like n=1 Tax=Ciona intestinalis TaxID=7719 RepID=UPI000180C876|nr:N-glycosylase/DNA lyase-like [Ciona intestinalis]XP_009859693.1 N-glycosylase/DNA lyase-like [Ciona intestinalis]|eukprot:XP_002131434.1 N-glycosylase/DNA lyase-like [Ciona intestinalis]